MKQTTFRLALLALITFMHLHRVHAQVELKTSPVLILFEILNLSVEKQLSESWGIEGDVWTVLDAGVYGTLNGKYYLNPLRGTDGIHVGGFLGGGSDFGIGVGFLAGYKWVSNKNFVFEAGLGIGRSVGEDVGGAIPYGKLHIGWRISGQKSQ